MFLIFIILITPLHYKAASRTNIDCPSCILIETSTEKILYEKNAHEIRYPASTTKIMTAILALEKCQLDDTATVSHEAIFTVPEGYAHANLREGEKLTINQLLHVLLIPSANDAANVLAEHISGSVSEFANLMNEKAKEIGCKNTHFVNPNGIHHKDHVSTAYDLAVIANYAMKNNTFRQIVKETRYTLPATNQYAKEDRIFLTTNDLLRENYSTEKDNYYYPYAIGIKTGYTVEAGNCLVACAKKDGLEVISVVLGGGQTEEGLSQRNLDSIALLNYAFDNYTMKALCEKNELIQEIPIKGASKDTPNLELKAKESIQALTKKEEKIEKIVSDITLEKSLKAPIAMGVKVGVITYEIDGTKYETDLIAGNTVEASGFIQIIFGIIFAILIFYFIYLLGKPKKKKGSTNSFKKKKKSKKTTKRGGGNYRFTLLQNF